MGSSATWIFPTHLMLLTPTHPGTTTRAGKPWSGGIRSPFIAYATMVSGSIAFATDMGRSTAASSRPVGITSTAVGLMRARCRISLSGTPAPLRDGVGAVAPGPALGHLSLVLLEEDAAVARALDEARHRNRRHPQQFVVADAQRVLHTRPLYAQPPRLLVDDGCRPVVADIEQRCGCQVPASVQVLPACLHADVVMEE